VRRVAAILLLASAAACAAFDPAAEQAVAVDEMIGNALSTARAPSGEQKAVLARAQKELAKDPSEANRLRVATLLAVLPSPLRNDTKAMELLDPLADASAAGFGRYAALLSAQVAERQRLTRELDQRARSEKEREQADKERDKREEALRQQLEALRSIERGILEREDRLRRRQK
jgi:hypothetical protein